MNSDDFIGFNEKSREDCINAFLNNNSQIGEIEEERLGMEILYSASKVIYNKLNNKDKLINIDIPKTNSNFKCIATITDKDFDEEINEAKN